LNEHAIAIFWTTNVVFWTTAHGSRYCHFFFAPVILRFINHRHSSALPSRMTAGAAGFLLLIQRPERQLNVDLHQNPTSTLPAN
jgi:hypothetical protein